MGNPYLYGVPAASALQLLFQARGVDMTLTTDQVLAQIAQFGRYQVTRVVVARVSGAFGTACAGGLYTAASKGGSALVAAGQSYASLTGANKITDCTMAAVAGTDAQSATALYLSLTTGSATALVADVFAFGMILD